MLEQREFHLSSEKFEGYVRYLFTKDGVFSGIDTTHARMTVEQIAAVIMNIPKSVDFIHIVKGATGVVVEAFFEVSFDDFWRKYDDKLNSCKKRTLNKWNKMNKNEQVRAYKYIDTYFSIIPQGTRKKYAETYLNAELWNN